MGLLDLVGTGINALAGYFGQKETNATNVQLGREQMQFQERMSGTAYQRATKDMEAAGLNPMLAYSQGGASSPGGAMPQIQSPIGAAISSANQGVQTQAALTQLEQSRAQTELIKAQAAKTTSETIDNAINTARAAQEVHNMRTIGSNLTEQGTGLRLQNRETQERIPGVMADSYRKWWESGYQGKDKSDEPPLGTSKFAAEIQSAQQAAATSSIETLLKQYELAPARAGSGFYSSDMGIANPYIKALLPVIRLGATVGRTLGK